MPEITMNDSFGRCIARTIKENEFRYNLEIGSWDGLGSTQCFIDGMKDFDGEKELICLELEKYRFAELKKNTAHLPWIRPLFMSSISKDQFIPKSFDEVWNSPHNNHTRGRCEYPRELVQKWYNDDIPALPAAGYLGGPYDAPDYDAVLIDGCEFTGYSEFALLRDRTECFFLDDVFHAYKCAQIYNELIADPNWRLVEEGRDLRNGYAVFVRREQ